MRWIYHIKRTQEPLQDARYTPARFSADGFVHCSFAHKVKESASIYFSDGDSLEVLRVDPVRLDVPVEVAQTPRGPMPHIMGSIPRDAIRARAPLHEVELIERRPPPRVALIEGRELGLPPDGAQVELLSISGALGADLEAFDLVVTPAEGPESSPGAEALRERLARLPQNRVLSPEGALLVLQSRLQSV